MEIKHLKKEYTSDKHDYSLGVRLVKEDFKNEMIREIVLKIKVPYPLSIRWSSTGEIVKKEEEKEGKKYKVFEIRKEVSLYHQDMPFEILSPQSSIGEIVYSVTRGNYEMYLSEALYWELYGDGIITQEGSKPLSELQNF